MARYDDGGRSVVRALALGGLALVAACSDQSGPMAPHRDASVQGVLAGAPDSAGPAVIIDAVAPGAERARVVAVEAGGGASIATDYVPVVRDTARIVVAGLHAGASYTYNVQSRGGGFARVGPDMTFIAGTLPRALRGASIVTTAGTAPTVPYIATELVVGDTKYAVIFDRTGALVWYRPVAPPSGLGDFEMQPSGTFTTYRGTSTGWQAVAGTWLELGLDGSVRSTWSAPPGAYVDPHEFRLRREGGQRVAYFFTYTIGPMDMSAHCGTAGQPTAAHQIVRADAGGLHAVFDARRRFTMADWVSPPLCGLGDFDHPNALDFDASGHLLVSWRNLGAITALDPSTGHVVWQLGGARSTLALDGDPLGGTGGQHSVRASGPKTIMIYDNGTEHVPPRSRMVEYAIAPGEGRARLTREYLDPHGIYTAFMGSVAPLASGGVLIGWSTAATITELDASGRRIWEGVVQVDGVSQQFYRALPVASLYHYQRP